MFWALLILTVYSQEGAVPDRIIVRSVAEGSGHYYASLSECQAWVDLYPPAAVNGRTDQRVCVPVIPAAK